MGCARARKAAQQGLVKPSLFISISEGFNPVLTKPFLPSSDHFLWHPPKHWSAVICPCPRCCGCPRALRPPSPRSRAVQKGLKSLNQPKAAALLAAITAAAGGNLVRTAVRAGKCFVPKMRDRKHYLPLLPPTALRDTLLPPEPGPGTAPGCPSCAGLAEPRETNEALGAGNHPSQ